MGMKPPLTKLQTKLNSYDTHVVVVSVFLALGFRFYVFFAPFVGKKMYQYIVMGIYNPLIISAFGLYIWCADVDPVDPGGFKSKKYVMDGRVKESNLMGNQYHQYKKQMLQVWERNIGLRIQSIMIQEWKIMCMFSSLTSIVEFVTNVSIDLIIIARQEELQKVLDSYGF